MASEVAYCIMGSLRVHDQNKNRPREVAEASSRFLILLMQSRAVAYQERDSNVINIQYPNATLIRIDVDAD